MAKKAQDIRDAGGCPSKELLGEIADLEREIANLERDKFDAEREYLKVAGQVDFDILADPFADFVDDVTNTLDVTYWAGKLGSTLVGGK